MIAVMNGVPTFKEFVVVSPLNKENGNKKHFHHQSLFLFISQKSFFFRCFCNESAEGSCDEIANAWSAWSNFNACSTSCGKGIQTRYRTCDGNNCTGEIQHC